MNFIHRTLFLAFSLAAMVRVQAAPEVVVAVRYLVAKGTSHAHLYLYKEDGAFLRQLTNDDAGQDRDPIFAPDGATIVFSRDTEKGSETWSIEPRGGGLHRLSSAPAWYQSARTSPFFSNLDNDPAQNADGAGRDPRFTAPDHSVELILHESKTDEDDQIDGAGHGKHYRLKDLKTGKEVEFGKLPGFKGVFDLLRINRDGDRYFLFDPPLRLAFFGLHLNSTDGDTTYALDLAARKFVQLSPNWASPIPLAGEAAFLTLTEVRYVPIAGSSKTANCTYLEHWDAGLQSVRYCRDEAAICYGGSIYRAGKKPPVVSVRKTEE